MPGQSLRQALLLGVSAVALAVSGATGAFADIITTGDSSFINTTGSFTTAPGNVVLIGDSAIPNPATNGTLLINDANGPSTLATGAHVNTVEHRVGVNEIGTATITGDGALWNAGTNTVVVIGGKSMAPFPPVGGDGTLTMSSGGDLNATLLSSGANAGSVGHISLDGVGTTVGLSGLLSPSGTRANLIVGQDGNGDVQVKNGASIDINAALSAARTSGMVIAGGAASLAGGIGSVTVDGTGSLIRIQSQLGLLTVGDRGTGTLDIINGGTVTLDNTDQMSVTFVGRQAASGALNAGNGTVTIDGSGSTLNAGEYMHVGDLGTGLLQVSNQGTVNVGDITFGRSLGGTGTGTLTNGATLNVLGLQADGSGPSVALGLGGTGTINVLSGSKVLIDPQAVVTGQRSTAFLLGGSTLAPTGNGTGHALVDGGGSEVRLKGDFATIFAGNAGNGDLTIQNGGQVIVESFTQTQTVVARKPGTTGSILIQDAGSKLAAGGQLVVGSDFNFPTFTPSGAGGDGTVTAKNGGSVEANSITLGATGKLFGDGGAIRSLTVVNDDGQLKLENSSIMRAQNVVVGNAAGSNGDAKVLSGSNLNLRGVDGSGNGPSILMGLFGEGTLTVGGGGKILINPDDPDTGPVETVTGTRSTAFVLGGSTLLAGANGTGHATIDGVGSEVRLQGAGASVFVGNANNGDLSIQNGAQVINESNTNTRTVVGRRPGVTGTVTVDGGGSKLSAGSQLLIGTDFNFTTSAVVYPGGDGTVTAKNGGTVDAGLIWIGPQGKLNGDGGSIRSFGGTVNDDGQLKLENSSTMRARTVVLGATTAASNGDAKVLSGSTMNLFGVDGSGNGSSILMGLFGNGTLTVAGGGKILLNPDDPDTATVETVTGVRGTGLVLGGATGVAGANGTGAATVDGAGSEVRIQGARGTVLVGQTNTGTLDIKNGGQVIVESDSASFGIIGRRPGATGTVTVDGAGSKLDTGRRLVIGADYNSTTDTIIAAGGNGTLNVKNGGTAEAQIIYVGATGKIMGNGTIIGNLTIDGTFAPGNSPGVVTELGDVVLSLASLTEIEIGGDNIALAEYDQINVADNPNTVPIEGHFTANGKVDVTFVNGFDGHIDSFFDVFVALDLTIGPDLDLILPTLDAGWHWETAGVTYGDGREALRLAIVREAPEPATLVLFGFAVAGLAFARRRLR